MEGVGEMKATNCHERRRRLLLLLSWIAFVVRFSLFAAENETNKPAHVSVSGFGLFGNREMVRLFKNFSGTEKLPHTLDRTFVEDAVLVLFARAKSQGYLEATVSGKFKMVDGSRQRIAWTNAIAVELPSDFAAQQARFRVRRGTRFYYDQLRFEGLHVFSEREARRYFIGEDTLFTLRANRIYTPELLEKSIASLREAYLRKGYREASVKATEIRRQPNSGAMNVTIIVDEGLPSVIRSVVVEMILAGPPQSTNRATMQPFQPYCDTCEQDIKRRLLAKQFHLGHPDATAEFTQLKREVGATNIFVDLLALVQPGPSVRIGEVRFNGNTNTRPRVVESRIDLKEGAPLDRLEVEKARQRLSRLGVFDMVNLRYEPVDEHTRDVIFDLSEGREMSLSVLGGYGSYELLRGGLEFEHHNVWGLAHEVRLRGVQSFKASSGELQYTVPDFLGENLNAFLRGDGLLREEETFTREEFGGSIGLQRRFAEIHTELSAHYDYEFLRALDLAAGTTNATGVSEARAATFNVELNHDRRDHPLLPTRGFRVFTKIEIASAFLGGNVDYQRVVISGSQHFDLNGGRLIHLGLNHGIAFTAGGNAAELPFNKRFFPGGADSIRGYQEGEASPLDAKGNQLGAETYTVGNFEFEQLLTHAWSIVLFFDAATLAQHRGDWPGDESLFSAGGGIRWRSPIGPVRLEYGHNLNPREHDPPGTIHFSIGFPF